MSSSDNILLENFQKFSENGGNLVIDAASTSDGPSPTLRNIIPEFQNLEFACINDNAREVGDSNWCVVEADAVNPSSVNEIISEFESKKTLYAVFGLNFILNPGYRIGEHLDDELPNKERRKAAIKYFSKSLFQMSIDRVLFTAKAGHHGYFSIKEMELLEEELDSGGCELNVHEKKHVTSGKETYELLFTGKIK